MDDVQTNFTVEPLSNPWGIDKCGSCFDPATSTVLKNGTKGTACSDPKCQCRVAKKLDASTGDIKT